jgi:hypothetical protein
MASIAIFSVRADAQAQPRTSIDTELIGEYAEAMMALGATFPPLVVFRDGDVYWLADGFHRFYAYKGCQTAEVECDVREELDGERGLRATILYSVGANAVHGVRPTNEDKRRAVMKLLGDPEWSKWPDGEIARRCGVGDALVASLRPNEPRTFNHGNAGKPATMNTTESGRYRVETDPPEESDQQPPQADARVPRAEDARNATIDRTVKELEDIECRFSDDDPVREAIATARRFAATQYVVTKDGRDGLRIVK